MIMVKEYIKKEVSYILSVNILNRSINFVKL